MYPSLCLRGGNRRGGFPRATRSDDDRRARGGFDAGELLVASLHVGPRGPDDSFSPSLVRLDADGVLAGGERERFRNAVVDAVDWAGEGNVTRNGRFGRSQTVKGLAAVEAANLSCVDVGAEVGVEGTSEIKFLGALVFNLHVNLERLTTVNESDGFSHDKVFIPHSLGVIVRGEFHGHGRLVTIGGAEKLPVDVARETVHLDRTRAELRPAYARQNQNTQS